MGEGDLLRRLEGIESSLDVIAAQSARTRKMLRKELRAIRAEQARAADALEISALVAALASLPDDGRFKGLGPRMGGRLSALLDARCPGAPDVLGGVEPGKSAPTEVWARLADSHPESPDAKRPRWVPAYIGEESVEQQMALFRAISASIRDGVFNPPQVGVWIWSRGVRVAGMTLADDVAPVYCLECKSTTELLFNGQGLAFPHYPWCSKFVSPKQSATKGAAAPESEGIRPDDVPMSEG
jgi:hypothetical protein